MMMVQNWADRARETINYRRFIKQFPPDIIKSIGNSKGLTKKCNDKNVYNVQSNVCIYIYIYIYIYICVCMCVCACVFVCVLKTR